jgi:hypothetical protein
MGSYLQELLNRLRVLSINDKGMASFYLPLKPELPPSKTCTYPNGRYSGVYERTNLIYKAT